MRHWVSVVLLIGMIVVIICAVVLTVTLGRQIGDLLGSLFLDFLPIESAEFF